MLCFNGLILWKITHFNNLSFVQKNIIFSCWMFSRMYLLLKNKLGGWGVVWMLPYFTPSDRTEVNLRLVCTFNKQEPRVSALFFHNISPAV